MRIAIVGESLIDFTATSGLNFEGHEGGAPTNSAIATARLGQAIGFISQLSTDLFGERLLKHLEGNGVDTRWVLRSDAPSTLAFVERTPLTNRYAFYTQGTADTQWNPATLPALPESCRFLQFGSIALLHEPAASRIIDLVQAQQGQRIVLFDPNVRLSLIKDLPAFRANIYRWSAYSNLMKFSDEDAAALAPGLSLAEAAASFMHSDSGPRAVVITRGGDGATLFRRGHAPLEIQAPKITVADTIGAGDTFDAGLTVGLLEQGVEQVAQLDSLPDAKWLAVLRFAAKAAAINCTREGANPPSRAELQVALDAQA
ncbi:carbohydrate kinase [Rhodoferax sp.]|uniref:carbohydrate kinase family protein n=1 Tax=Rhodoferax sp. TaxID=50421 RepID=UPI0025F7EBD3|nr:carbohydrate kinase [Rhodoferax sp.]